MYIVCLSVCLSDCLTVCLTAYLSAFLLGFLERIDQADMLTRRQSLPPLASLKLNPLHSTSRDSESPVVANTENQILINGETEIPIPGEIHEPALTPGGSFSPGVNELLESFKHPTRALKRSESSGSGQFFRQHRRQGSNGSSKYCTLENIRKSDSHTSTPVRGTPVRGRSRSNSICSQKAALESTSATTHPDILYSKLDESDSQAGTESDNNSVSGEEATSTSSAYPESSLQSAIIARGLNSARSKSSKASLNPNQTTEEEEVVITDSAADTVGTGTGTDGHEADSESNAADCDTAGEEGNTSDRFSESSEAVRSSSPVETDLTSDSNVDGLAGPEVVEWLPENFILGRPTGLNLSVERAYEDESAVPAISTSRRNIVKLISQFENSTINGDDNQSEATRSGTTTPKLEIPFHIRRDSELETCQYAGNYSPVSVEESLNPTLANALRELGGQTVIVRGFFENVGTKRAPDLQMQRSISSTELEDSGFQVCRGSFRKIPKGGQKHVRRHLGGGGRMYIEQYSILKG